VLYTTNRFSSTSLTLSSTRKSRALRRKVSSSRIRANGSSVVTFGKNLLKLPPKALTKFVA
jgi:hypothetical protein